jgi:predicted Zn-dependent protease with MMP-like domain
MSEESLRFFDILYLIRGRKLNRNFTRRGKVIGQCTEELQKTILVLTERGWTTHTQLWNAGLFINVVSHDLSIISHDIIRVRDDWKRRYLARALALILYEISEDIPTVLGKKFQAAMKTLSVPDEMKAKLNSEKNKFSDFWNEHRELLKEIRISVAAHRDHDAMEQLRIIEKIDILDMHSLGAKLGSRLNDLGEATQAILAFTGQVEPPELNNKQNPNQRVHSIAGSARSE